MANDGSTLKELLKKSASSKSQANDGSTLKSMLKTTSKPVASTVQKQPVITNNDNSNKKSEIENRMSELDKLMKDTDTKLRRIGYTETERNDFQNQYKTYKNEYYSLKKELDALNPVTIKVSAPDPNAPKSYFRNPVEQSAGDKVANFFKVTLPEAVEDTWDDIKEPFTGPSLKQVMTEAKLSPKLLVEDAKIQMAKEDPTREDYALVKQTQEAIKKYGMPDSNIKAITEDTTQLQQQLASAEKTWQVSPVDALGANALAGGASIFGNLGSFANSLGADKIPLVKEVTNFAVEGARKAQENAQQYNRGSYGEALGTVTQGIVNLVPYFVLGTGKVAVKGATAVTKYAKYIEPIIKNPSFWYSLTSMWGNKYQEKLNEGNNRFEALGNAIIYALPAALIEVSGGIGAKGKEAQSLLRTMGEEIGEEIAQDIMSGVSDKIVTNHELPVFSTTEDAIINPKNLAKTALYTAPIVGIAGGANNVRNSYINRNNANQQQIQEEKSNILPTAKETTTQIPENSKVLPKATQNYSPVNSKQVLAEPNISRTNGKTTILPTAQNQSLESRKNAIIEEINNNSILSNEDKQGIIEVIKGTQFNSQMENSIREMLNVVNNSANEELTNISNNFDKNKAKYAQYNRDIANYDTKYIENAKNTIKTKDGKRTKEQWLSIAKAMGNQIYEMSNNDIEMYAFKSWIENKPNNAQNLNRQSKKYVRFGMDEWVNTIYNTVNANRARTQTKTNENTKTENKTSQLALPPSKMYVSPEGEAMLPETFVEYEKGKLQLPTPKTQQTYDTAVELKVSPEVANKVMDISKKIDVPVKFFEADSTIDGFYENGVININKNSPKPAMKIFKHELTHHLKNKGEYSKVSKAIMDSNVFYDMLAEKGMTLDEYRNSIIKTYGEKGIKLDTEMANEEIIAKFAEEKLFNDEASIERLAQTNPDLITRIKQWIDDMVVKFKGTSEEKELRKIQNMYKKALEQVGENTKNSGVKYSFAGEKAKNANITKLAEARQLESTGMSAEEIYQKTGWYRGNEGKWRFEIDDNNSKIILNDNEYNIRQKVYQLSEIYENDALFEAYPKLKELDVIFMEKGQGFSGRYSPNEDAIKIDEREYKYSETKKYLENLKESLESKSAPYLWSEEEIKRLKSEVNEKLSNYDDAANNKGLKSLLNHEIQHWIQKEEGFSRGSNLEYWRKKLKNKNDYTPGIEEEYYKNTAGEQEARNVQDRLEMSAEEKKQNMPFVKNEKTVYAEDNEVSDSIGGKKGMKNLANSELTTNYNKAIKMSEQGYTNNDIIKQTGWFKDKNGDWKFEFTDKYMKLKENIKLSDNITYKLGDILEHDILFTAYPQLADYKIEFEDLGNKRGTFIKQTKTILLNPKIFTNKTSVEGTLIHEIQHIIQRMEGFETGRSSSQSKLAYYNSLGEIEANDTRERFVQERNGTLNRSKVVPESSKANPKHSALDKYLQNRKPIDKIKDSIYQYFKGGTDVYEEDDFGANSREDVREKYNYEEDSQQNSRLVDGRRGHKQRRVVEAGKEPAFSVQTDNQGRTLSEEQQEFFKNSKIRDDKGRLIEVYHRTNQDFTEFSRNKIGSATDDGLWGSGFYFSNLDHTDYGKNLIKGYLNITNPFVVKDFKTIQEMADYLDIVERNFHYEPDGLIRVSYNQIGQFTSHVIEKGHDGVIAEHDNGVCEYVIFEPNQIKNIDNTNPTENSDIRYSINNESKNESNVEESNVLETIAPQKEQNIDDIEEEAKVANVLTKPPKKRVPDKLETAKDVLARKLLDTGNTINKVAKISNDKILYPLFNNTKQARQSAEYMIGEKQTDIQGNVVGNSLVEIFRPIKAKGEEYTKNFYEYLLHMHNIDRMAQNKPVFGETVKAEDSQRIANELLEKYPEFEKLANKVYVYNRNLMQWRVDSGLVSKEQADEMNKMYPHYVPTFRDMSGTAGAKVNKNGIEISKTIKKATGSTKNILPLDLSMARQTMQTVQAARRNLFGNRLLNDAIANKDKLGEYINAIQKSDSEVDIDSEKDPNLDYTTNNFTIYRNGKATTMKVNNGIFEGLKSISAEIDNTDNNKLMATLAAPNRTFKQLVTGMNPMFLAKNFSRDIQDSFLYSKNLRKFIKNYPGTFKDMVNNSKEWQLYKSLGGTGSSFFDYETGIDRVLNKGKWNKISDNTMGRIEELNMMIEQAPRFSEFKSTIEKAGNTNYDTLMEAMHNAADITVNFGRSGSWVKMLNSSFVPFLNPSVQGTDKIIRTIANTHGGEEWGKLVAKAALFGILPSLINELLYGDDEDYQNLTDRDKDVNFILKYGDNKWLKIPKGRVVSFAGNLVNRGVRIGKGQEVEWSEFLSTAADQTAPISPFESNIISPILAVKNNTTWYGSDIVPQRLQGYKPGEQYDEKTDKFSKWLGGLINYSPKKINYLIDAYTGVIGDFALPLTTPYAETNPFTKAFTIDGEFTNEISNKFYKAKEKYDKKQNSKPSAPVVTRYLNKQNDMANDLYAEIRNVQNSDLPDAEKTAKARELRELINLIEATALTNLEAYEKAADKYINKFPNDSDKSIDYAYIQANNELFGAEYAVKTYNKSKYEKNKNKNMKSVLNDILKNFKSDNKKSLATQKRETLPTAKDIPTRK